jgi:D-alanyl-D-alanine carboxypeptidase/D-alanyl-D-alanine-endopeptidase (penicillin-binding protein 4)
VRRLILPLLLVFVLLGTLGTAVWREVQDPGAADAPAASGATTPVLSARRVPAYLAEPGADARLRQRLDTIVARAPQGSCLTVEADGRLVLAHNPDLPLVPASTEKLLVADAVLEQLGPDATFRTTVRAGAAPANGAIQGDLHLVGSGDPMLSTASWRDRGEPTMIGTSLEALADAIVQAGVTSITGRVVGDEGRYDAERYVGSWPPRFAEQNQTGPLSALTVNQGFESFPFQGDPGAPETPTADPPTFAASALTNLLAQRGVTIGGPPAAGATPAGAVEVAGVDSAPVGDIVGFMLSTSDNMTAELLTKELGALVSQEGTTAAGTAAIGQLLGGQELPLEGVTVADGSGLSPDNRTTCLLLSDILEGEGPDSAMAEGLAVAGESGTLAGFLAGTDVAGRLSGKTGSLNDVRSIAGFVEDLQGDTVSYSFVINQGDFVSPEAVALRDEVGLALGTYPETPDLAQIGPQP